MLDNKNPNEFNDIYSGNAATQTFRRRMQRLHMNGIPIKATTSQTAQNTIIHM